MTTLFISDLHLEHEQSHAIQAFIQLLDGEARSADALYILGDFVEYWLGDDDTEHQLDSTFAALKRLSDSGVPVYLMHGNRDFLIGHRFAEQYGIELLPDPSIINLYGTPTLLMHGDTLCTDDIAYQQFRQLVRSPAWQADFLSKSLSERRQLVQGYRQESQAKTQDKTEDIMDVNQHSVESIMLEQQVQQLIHGHTHRPAIHEFTVNGQAMRRIVLSAWHDYAGVLHYTSKNYQLEKIPYAC